MTYGHERGFFGSCERGAEDDRVEWGSGSYRRAGIGTGLSQGRARLSCFGVFHDCGVWYANLCYVLRAGVDAVSPNVKSKEAWLLKPELVPLSQERNAPKMNTTITMAIE